MNFEQFFKQYVGEFGHFQILCLIIVGLAAVMDNDSITHNFIAGDQVHWCKVDELVNNNIPHENQKYIAIPDEVEGTDTDADIADDNNYASCRQLNISFTNYSYQDYYYWDRSPYANTTTFECSQWVYDQSDYVSTYTSEWNLVCGEDWKISFISTALMIGILIGSIASGALSDSIGRFTTNVIFLAIKIFGDLLSAFSPNYITMIIARIIIGAGSQGCWLITYVLMMEMSGSKYRPALGVIVFCFHSVGFSLVPVYAYFIRDHVGLQLMMTIPMFVFFFAYVLLPESPRWLLVQNKRAKAEKILRTMASVNKRVWPSHIDFNSVEVSKEAETKSSSGAWGKFVRTPMLVARLAIICLTWFTCSLMYYALSLNTGSLAGNIYLNTMLMGLVEIPANILCFFTLNWQKTGRRLTCGLGLVISGLFSFLSAPFIVLELGGWSTAMSLLSKSFVTLAFCGIYLYSSELLPTEVRNGGIGFASMCARFSGMIAPFIGGPLANVWLTGPAIICGSCAVISGVLCFFLPETLGTPTQETVDDAIAFGKKKKKNEPVNAYENMSYDKEHNHADDLGIKQEAQVYDYDDVVELADNYKQTKANGINTATKDFSSFSQTIDNELDDSRL